MSLWRTTLDMGTPVRMSPPSHSVGYSRSTGHSSGGWPQSHRGSPDRRSGWKLKIARTGDVQFYEYIKWKVIQMYYPRYTYCVILSEISSCSVMYVIKRHIQNSLTLLHQHCSYGVLLDSHATWVLKMLLFVSENSHTRTAWPLEQHCRISRIHDTGRIVSRV